MGQGDYPGSRVFWLAGHGSHLLQGTSYMMVMVVRRRFARGVPCLTGVPVWFDFPRSLSSLCYIISAALYSLSLPPTLFSPPQPFLSFPNLLPFPLPSTALEIITQYTTSVAPAMTPPPRPKFAYTRNIHTMSILLLRT